MNQNRLVDMNQNTHLKNQSNDFTPQEFFMGILRNWLLIISLVTLSVVLTILFYMTSTPKYTSTARILLEDRKSVLTGLSAVNSAAGGAISAVDAKRVVSDQVQYLKSLDLAKGVDEIIHFGKIPEFMTEINKGKLDIYAYFAKNLKINTLPDSNVIEISYTAENAKMAAEIVGTITNVYKKQKANEDFNTNNQASNWLALKVKELQDKQRIADAKIVDYRIQNGIFEGQNNQKLLSQQLTALNANLVTASGQRAETVARADLINRLLDRNGNLDSARDVLNSVVIQQYRQQVLTLQRRIAELSETLLPSHPRMLSLVAELRNVNEQIRSEARNVMLSLRNEVEISHQRENSLKSELNGLKQIEASSLEQSVELNALKSEASSNRILLDSYLAKYREADVRNKTDFEASTVHTISAAAVPLKPSGITRSAVIAVMAVVGMLAGIVIATFKTLSQHSKPTYSNAKSRIGAKRRTRGHKPSKRKPIQFDAPQQPDNRADIAKYLPQGTAVFDDLAFMAAIPLTTSSNRQNNLLKNDILTHLDTEYAISFIDLVDNLMAQSNSEFQKHFMISGIEGDEDSYEALMNLGRILDMKGARVLIMDLDADSQLFSKSVVDNTNFGFSDVINGKCYFEDCVVKDNKSGADILLAGGNISLIEDVIMSTEMEEFLDDLDQIYDVILIHSNDVSQMHVTAFIDSQVDLTLLVADWEDRATEQLQVGLMALKDFQGSDFGLLLMSTDMREFDREVA